MAKIYFRTYGCSLNQSDSELMAGLLKEGGFEITEDIDDANVIIINTCTVKGPSESRFLRYLEKIKEKYPYKKVIIAGCIPQTDPEKLGGYSLIGTSQITNIVQIVENTIHDTQLIMLTREKNKRLNLPKLRKNKIIAIIPICEGCLGEPCAYCKVKAARGELRSYPKEEIIREIMQAKKDCCKEIWLTAQDTGCYGKDIKTNLPSLLEEIISIEGDFKIRLGMLNPNHALEYLEDLIKIFKSEKMFKFIHIPVQSGNNKILKAMRRKYDAEDFFRIVQELREEIPDITIATDIIVGFPGETEEQFNDSLNLIKNIRPDVLNLSKFWKRPKTEAAKMENHVPGAEIKRRSKLFRSIFNNIAYMQNEQWLGWEGDILIDEKGKEDTMIGRNFAYRPVVIKGNFPLGTKLRVKIKKFTNVDLRV